MLQAWLTVAGLALDFIGFVLLLREWWLAFFSESRQIGAEEQLERARTLRNLRPPSSTGTDPFATLDRMQDEQAIRKARAAHRSAMAARRRAFVFAAALIILGFLLQLVGAWPIS